MGTSVLCAERSESSLGQADMPDFSRGGLSKDSPSANGRKLHFSRHHEVSAARSSSCCLLGSFPCPGMVGIPGRTLAWLQSRMQLKGLIHLMAAVSSGGRKKVLGRTSRLNGRTSWARIG